MSIWVVMEWSDQQPNIVAAFSEREHAEAVLGNNDRVTDVWIEEIKVLDAPLGKRYLKYWFCAVDIELPIESDVEPLFLLTDKEHIEEVEVSGNGRIAYAKSSVSAVRALQLARDKRAELQGLKQSVIESKQ